METIRKIFNKHCTLVSKDYNEYIILNKEAFIKDLESLQPCEEKKVTDEEIERWADNDTPKDIELIKAQGIIAAKIIGAKWMRSKLI
ncbi:MAG: hypothetical protein MUO72_09620 [Bacteroidales bacterium]|nr:hypothetical protein [Bacteroidales bacterium]